MAMIRYIYILIISLALYSSGLDFFKGFHYICTGQQTEYHYDKSTDYNRVTDLSYPRSYSIVLDKNPVKIHNTEESFPKNEECEYGVIIHCYENHEYFGDSFMDEELIGNDSGNAYFREIHSRGAQGDGKDFRGICRRLYFWYF